MTCISNEVLVSVAPVAAAGKVVIPERIAEGVYECCEERAAMVHLHVRSREDRLMPDMSLLEETLAIIRRDSDIIIEVSAGGVSDLNTQEHYAPLCSEMVETYSLNVGSMNLGRGVYCNPIDDIGYCAREILKQKKTPEMKIFEIGHTWAIEQLMKKYDFTDPVLLSIVLGRRGEAPATPQTLAAMMQMIPSNAMWGITQTYRKDSSLPAGVVDMGARTVRIRFEDSNYPDPQTRVTSNAPFVEKAVKLLRTMDKEPMRPGEARAPLGIER